MPSVIQVAEVAALHNRKFSVTPFHWEIEFPEVFQRENSGFDAFVGNPPFMAALLSVLTCLNRLNRALAVPIPAKVSMLTMAWPRVWACQVGAGAASAPRSQDGLRRMLKARGQRGTKVFIIIKACRRSCVGL